MFIFERERDRERETETETETEADRIGSRLCADSSEPDGTQTLIL